MAKADNAVAQAAAQLASAPVAAKPVKVVQVALRGGPVVTHIQVVAAKPYRVTAPHNQAWWAAIVKACEKGPAEVAPLLATPTNPNGVPTHFIGYAIKRGHLAANPK